MADPIDYDDLRAKAVAASPGPWTAQPFDEDDAWCGILSGPLGTGGGIGGMVAYPWHQEAACEADAAFIAAANPQTVLALLDHIDQQAAPLASSRGQCVCDRDTGATSEECPQHGYPYETWVAECQRAVGSLKRAEAERDELRAALVELAPAAEPRVLPDVEMAARAIEDWLIDNRFPHAYDTAYGVVTAVLALFSEQPTVDAVRRAAKVEALRELHDEWATFCLGTQGQHLLCLLADRIEREAGR